MASPSNSKHRNLSRSTSTTTSSGLSPEWTHEMRDRQARGKDPMKDEGGSVRSDDASEAESSVQIGERQVFPTLSGGTSTVNILGRIRNKHPEDSYLDKERRGEAMSVLDNPEALLAHAQANSDSVTGQRVRFLRQLCGYDDDRDRQQVPTMRNSKGVQYTGGR